MGTGQVFYIFSVQVLENIAVTRIAFSVLLVAFIGGAHAGDNLGTTAKQFAQAMMEFNYNNIAKLPGPSKSA
jgi:hypothetical protein